MLLLPPSAFKGLLLILLVALVPSPLFAESSPNQLKAGFLVKILGYLTLPIKPASKPLICTAASETMNSEIRRYLSDNSLEQKIYLRDENSVRSLDQCWLLYLENSEVRGLALLLAEAKGKGILSVGEAENFLSDGGMLHLYFANRRLAFDVNKPVTDIARIKIDARLLYLARKVTK